MSFGNSGGFAGFGSNNNQSSFSGFGPNNNNSGGFGSNANTGGSIFGGANNNTGGGIFGSNTNNSTSSPFGGGGGFGSNSNTTTSFGSKPFGSTTGGGLFGNNNATSGSTFGGGFGSTNNNTTTSTFGGGNAGGGLFGQNKSTPFGATATTNSGAGSLFGGGNTTGGFGSNNTTSGFGSTTSAAFGGAGNTNNGTAGTPFTPFTEKDQNGTSQYQTITFQQPYANFSLEELRGVDYAQGRRFGNQNGQAGAFGQSTGFGGFGSTNNTTSGFGANTTSTGGGLFGNQNNNSTGFGSNTNPAFGANNNTTTTTTTTNSGGLFGQNKPGGLFGGTNQQSGTTGGLFNSTSNTGGAFGSGGTGFGASTSGAGGGLFAQNNQTQNKPFGSFGNNTTNTASTPFGGSSTTPFGQSTGGGLFGQQNQASATPAFGGNAQTTSTGGGGLFGNTGGAFGQNQQNQTQGQASTGLFGGGFGQNNQNQQKPGGLFGGATTNTGGGLFGQQPQQQQQQQQQPPQAGGGGGLFAPKTGTGLFGQAAATQPATGGLFSGSTGNTGSTGGGLFGALGTQNNQQNSGTGLFGGATNQQKPSGLFGSSTTNTNTGGGLFSNMGQNNNNNTNNNNAAPLGGSLFGNQSQQQQNQQPMNNSLFGASGSSLLQTSMNTNPYGNDALFVGLTTPAASPGPLATPLSSSQKNKRSAILPQHKLNPSQSTRLLTPQGKRSGYGFTYSTYGTPTSAQSSPLNGSMFSSGSLSRSLGRSLSTSNLRNSFTPDTSILAPGAFSTNGRSYGNGGSLKKLNLNRAVNARPSLFDDAPSAKRVSFASPSSGNANNNTNGTANNSSSGALILHEEPEAASPGGSSTNLNGETSNGRRSGEVPNGRNNPSIPNGVSGRPEMEQVNGKDLTPVPENRISAPRTSASLNIQNGQTIDPTAGDYYSSPSLDELKRMSKSQLQSIPNFVIGRDKIGKIEFNLGKPVDLSNVPLEKLFGDIVSLNHRNATVYGQSCSVPKPPLGSGLNHPSRITMGNSWPRGANRQGKGGQKHIERLKRVGGTEFEDYRPETGEWLFKVPHFSSYGFDYDDPDDHESSESSELSPVPETPAQLGYSQMSATPQQDSFASASQSSPDDTFDFKRGMHKRSNVPGQFGDEAAYDDDKEMEDNRDESFLGERSVGSFDGRHEYDEASGSDPAEDQDMADSVSRPGCTTEQEVVRQADTFKDSIKPKSILKASQILRPTMGTPSKGPTVFDDDWANALQRTISPRKQDRQALRESQGDVLRERNNNTASLMQSIGARKPTTTIDKLAIMGSLLDDNKGRKDSTTKRGGHGIQYPYAKRPKTSDELKHLSGFEQDFHNCNKPHFSEDGILVYASKGAEASSEDLYHCGLGSIVGATKDIRFKQLPTFTDAVPPTISLQKEYTRVLDMDNVSKATLKIETGLDFTQLADTVTLGTVAGTQEQQAWQLLSLLFDDNVSEPSDMSGDKLNRVKALDRKEKLSQFWQNLVFEDAQNHVKMAATFEEKAIAYLSCNSVADACDTLFQGRDLRLATMVAQIGGDTAMRQDMTSQIEEWRRMDVLAEMDESIRALYELISGNCAQSEGKVGGGRENKALTFNIASRFNLDWRRAFGLRLWYGTMADEPIELAVAQFADALRDGKEDVKPVPWFIEQGLDMSWDDPDKENREDLLWGILKLYASPKLDLPVNIEDVLAPENVSGHPLNTRLSFQLFQLFKSRREDANEEDDRIVPMPYHRSTDTRWSLLSSTTSMNEHDQADDPIVELGDKLTLTYAASLHTPEHWTTAAWVYIHLSSSAMRSYYIRSLLARFSNTYELEESNPTFEALSNLRIPEQWMHEAAALQAKTDGDALCQATHLIKAHELQEAHEVLCRSVGPDSVISRDYDALRELMGGFLGTPPSSPTSERGRATTGKRKEPVPGWAQGGQIYFDYVELLDLTSQRSGYRVDEELNNQINQLLKQLQSSLESVAKDRWDSVSLEERVALSDIAGTVANLMSKNKLSERARVLHLPLTEDLWLRHAVELSASYYRNVVS